MQYRPQHPEFRAPGEPYLPEPASDAEAIFEKGAHGFVSLIPAAPEEDEDYLLSIKQVFDRETLELPTPLGFAKEQLEAYLRRYGIDVDPDDLILATLYLQDVNIKPGPWKAQVAHSMTLTQAAIGNWQRSGSGDWLEHLGHPLAWTHGGYAVSELGELPKDTLANSEAYDAIYRRTSPQAYEPSNQVDLDPVEFRQFVWDLDLQTRYLEHLNRFWHQHESNYHMLLKGNLVHAALLQRTEGSLSEAQAALVLKSMMLHSQTSWENTSYRYFEDNPVSSQVSISELLVYGYTASDIMVIHASHLDDIVLYIPGNSSPLHGFANQREMRDWLCRQSRDPRKRAALASHFSHCDRGDGFFHFGVDRALHGIAVYPRTLDRDSGCWSPVSTIGIGTALRPYPFTHFRRTIKQRFFAESQHQFVSQADVRLKQFAHGLEVATNVVGAIAIAMPELAPVAVALGAGMAALGAGEMIAAKNQQELQEGESRLAFGLLNALPLAGELTQLGAGAKALSESEYATDEAAQAAHASEVQGTAPVATAARPGASWPLLAEFKVQRPVLDTLEPALRERLSVLQVTDTVSVSGGGKGTFVANGRRYISIRNEVYRVEWLDHEQQLRIRTPHEPREWGPFVKADDEGYWDLDLRFGLRGGNPLLLVLDHPPLPTQEVEGIMRQPLIPKVEVSVPVDDLVEEEGQYFALLKTPESLVDRLGAFSESRVEYDADAAAWRTDDGDYIWRKKPLLSSKVLWKTGTASELERARDSLPLESRFIVHRFPGLPQLPTETSAITEQVHTIWVGEKRLPATLAFNLRENVTRSSWKFFLHVDADQSLVQTIRESLQGIDVEVVALRDQQWFSDFVAGPYGEGYNYFRFPTSPARNYASASDYLRYRLLDEHGGMYMDLDDQWASLPDQDHGLAQGLQASAQDILVGGRYPMPWNSEKLINTSHFASHAGNPVLARLLDTANRRYRALPELFKNTPRPTVDGDLMHSYMETISQLAGPKLFNDVMSEVRPDYFDVLEQAARPSNIVSQTYEEFRKAALDFYFPFRLQGPMPIKPGSAHSWISN